MASKSKIRVSPQELKDLAVELKKSKANHEEIRKQMTNFMVQLAVEWQGEASDAYIKQFTAMQPAFSVFDENTEQIAKIIEQTAKRFENKDKELANKLEAID